MPFDSKSASIAGQKSSNALPKELSILKSYSKAALLPMLMKYSSMSISELKAKNEDNTLPAIEKDLISFIVNSIKKGNGLYLQFVMDRILGKSKESMFVEVESPDLIEYKERSEDELTNEVIEIAKVLKDLKNG